MKRIFFLATLSCFANLLISKVCAQNKVYLSVVPFDTKAGVLLDLDGNKKSGVSGADVSFFGQIGIDSKTKRSIALSRISNEGFSTKEMPDGRFALLQNNRVVKVFDKYLSDGTYIKSIGEFSDGLISFETDERRYGFLDTFGNIVINAKFIWVDKFINGKCIIKKHIDNDIEDDYYTYIDKSGNEPLKRPQRTVNPQDDNSAIDFSYLFNNLTKNELAVINHEKGYELVYFDSVGNILFSLPDVDYISEFRDGVATFRTGSPDRFGLVDRAGKVLIDPIYDYLYYKGGLLIFGRLDGESNKMFFGIMDKDKRILLEDTWSLILPFVKENTLACRNGKCFLMNKKGELLNKIPFEAYLPYREGDFLKYFYNEFQLPINDSYLLDTGQH